MRPLFLHGHSRPLTQVLFNPDGDLLFTAAKDARLCVWLVRDGARLGTYDCGKGVVWAIDITADSRRLIAASADMKVVIFDVVTSRVLHIVKENGPVKSVEWNKNPICQDKFAVAHSSFGSQSKKAIKVYHYNPCINDYERTWSISDYNGNVNKIFWGPFDETIISIHDTGEVMVWCAANGDLLLGKAGHHKKIGHDMPCTSATLNKQRTLMLTCSTDTTAKLYDTADWKLRKTYNTDRPLNACGISPLYDAKENRRCHILLGGGQAAEDVTTTTATEGKFQSLIYHMVFAQEIGSVKGHFGPVNTLAWMPDGGGFASGGEDGYVRMYHFDQDYFSDKFQ